MSGIFSKPKIPPPPPTAAMEMPRTATVDEQVVDRERGDMLRRRRGRAATVLNAGYGDAAGVASGSVATKSLLGQ